MTGVARLVIGAVAAAALAALILPTIDARATSLSRLDLAAAGLRLAGTTPADAGAEPDLTMTVGVYRQVGVDIREIHNREGLRRQGAAELDLGSRPPAGPAAGDFAMWQTASAPASGPRTREDVERVGLFVSNRELIVYDPSTRSIRRAYPAQLTADPAPQPPASIDASRDPHRLGSNLKVAALPGTFVAWRLQRRLWPGVDDASVPPGRVALMHPDEVAAAFQWGSSHPRDADNRWWHHLALAGEWFLTITSTVTATVVRAALAGMHWLLEHTGMGRAVMLAGLAVLGGTFDGRPLHRWLTRLLTFSAGGPLLTIAAAAVWAGRRLGIRPLEQMGAMVFNGVARSASVAVTFLTGIDDSEHASILSAVIGVVTVPLIWAKPLAASVRATSFAGRIAAVAERSAGVTGRVLPGWAASELRRTPAEVARGFAWFSGERGPLMASERVGNAISMRPTEVAAMLRLGGELIGSRTAAWTGRGAALAPASATTRALAWHGADIASLAWRPGSVVSEFIGQSSDLSAAVMRGQAWPLPGLRQAVSKLPGPRRDAILRAARFGSTHLAPRIAEAGRINQIHWGAGNLATMARGDSPAPVPPPPAPMARRLLLPSLNGSAG